MTREEAVERLCTIYQSQFDINRCSAEQTPLAVTMDFYALSDKYVLSKKAKLWEAKFGVCLRFQRTPSDQGDLRVLRKDGV